MVAVLARIVLGHDALVPSDQSSQVQFSDARGRLARKVLGTELQFFARLDDCPGETVVAIGIVALQEVGGRGTRGRGRTPTRQLFLPTWKSLFPSFSSCHWPRGRVPRPVRGPLSCRRRSPVEILPENLFTVGVRRFDQVIVSFGPCPGVPAQSGVTAEVSKQRPGS